MKRMALMFMLNRIFRWLILAFGFLLFTGCASDKNSKATPPMALMSLLTPNLQIIAGNADEPGALDGTGQSARFKNPHGLTADVMGNLYVADTSNYSIRKITPTGAVITISGSPMAFGNEDGTDTTARFVHPRAITVDAEGNLYVTDMGNQNIRKISPTGLVTTLTETGWEDNRAKKAAKPAKFNYPLGIVRDQVGNMYIADSSNHSIRKISAAGVVTTLAGKIGALGDADGVGGDARFCRPNSIAIDAENNLYVTEMCNHTIRKITPESVVSTLAGKASENGNVDGIGQTARFDVPRGIAINEAGNLYVTDGGSRTIRKVTQEGIVTTVAGVTNGKQILRDDTFPGNTFSPSAIARVAPGVFAVTSGNSVLKLTIP